MSGDEAHGTGEEIKEGEIEELLGKAGVFVRLNLLMTIKMAQN